ncbi:hypothetical protein [Variovorax sp. N23]|uniref:hypothetical protein n=1 Tax=Variovorax sp. N23 TaxID=2980555 RepID=UPI0021C90F69|nr:hypothetical protein [Variovorax sp. N23]MCU4119727.1 hypothetical protein [Variovorax sp. N23]
MTWLIDQLPAGQPVLDASVIINLLGTHQPVEVLRALGHRSLVEERTLKEVRKHPVPDLRIEPVLDELRTQGLLEEVRMTDVEYGVYLGYVSPPLGQRLDVGESAALAIAARGACIVLDERKARNRAAGNAPNLVVVSSLRLFIASAHRAGWAPSKVRHLVESARASARMGVPRDEQSLLAQVLAA